jgi:hypothetical protein
MPLHLLVYLALRVLNNDLPERKGNASSKQHYDGVDHEQGMEEYKDPNLPRRLRAGGRAVVQQRVFRSLELVGLYREPAELNRPARLSQTVSALIEMLVDLTTYAYMLKMKKAMTSHPVKL